MSCACGQTITKFTNAGKIFEHQDDFEATENKAQSADRGIAECWCRIYEKEAR